MRTAVWAREGALMRLLIDSGAITNDQTRRHLSCLALDISARDLAEDLSAIGDPECVAQQAYEQVLQRSRDHEAGQ